MTAGALTLPDDPDGVVHAGNVSTAEQAAWEAAVGLGLPVTRADLRSILRAAQTSDRRQEAAMTAAVFRVTQLDLDEAEEVSAVHAVADDATAGVLRALAGRGMAVTGRAGSNHELVSVLLDRVTLIAAFQASERIPADDPQYRPALNEGLSRVWGWLLEIGG